MYNIYRTFSKDSYQGAVINKITKMRIKLLSFGLVLLCIGIFLTWHNSSYRYIFQAKNEINYGQVANAVKTLTKSASLFPDNKKINFLLANAYLLTDEIEKANKLALNKEKLEQDAEFKNFLIDLADANKRKGNQKLAVYFVNQYLQLQIQEKSVKNEIENLIRIGQIYPEKSIKMWEKAYKSALKLKKKNDFKSKITILLLPAYFEKAEYYLSNKNYEKAINIISSAETISKNPYISLLKAKALSKAGRFELAQSEFEKALQQDPNKSAFRKEYIKALEEAINKTSNENKRNIYRGKINILSSSHSPSRANLITKIINFNAKYKITNGNLIYKIINENKYPSLAFKLSTLSDIPIKKFKVEFQDENEKLLDSFETNLKQNELNELIEVTCMCSTNDKSVHAKLYINDTLAKEFK